MATTNPTANSTSTRPLEAVRIRVYSGTSRNGANFVHDARPTKSPRAAAEVESQNPQTRIAGRIVSFELELMTYVEGVRDPCEREGRRQPSATEAPADQREADERQPVEQKRGGFGSRAADEPLQPAARYPGTYAM